MVMNLEGRDEVRHYVYVDNLGIASPHRAVVSEALAQLTPAFDGQGLVLHPGEIQHEDIQALGVSMRGDLMASRVTARRHYRLRQAIVAVLRRKHISGRLLEVVLGHITFCCLCNRQLLCIFSSIYKFVRRNYFKPAPLWDSVRSELRVFKGLMVFLQSDWWRGWNPLVTASDASLEGYGVSTSFWPLEEVKRVGRQVERSRFRRPATTQARSSALGSAGFVQDEVTHRWRMQEINDEELVKESGWEVNEGFSKVPARYLAKSLWEPKLWGRWSYNAGILELEGRALVKSLKRVAVSVHGRDIRQLLLVDNMAVALSFDRFRSRNFRLLLQIRKFAAYLLARNISSSVRWIPSELNNSDEPSRFFSEEESKLLTEELDRYHAKEGVAQTRDTSPSPSPSTKAEGHRGNQGKPAEECRFEVKSQEDHNAFGVRLAGPAPDAEDELQAWDYPALQPLGLGPAKLQRVGEEEEGPLIVQYERDNPGQADQEKSEDAAVGGLRHGVFGFDPLGAECCGSLDAEALQEVHRGVHALRPAKRIGLEQPGSGGQVGRGLHERHVPQRFHGLSSGSSYRGHSPPLPGLREVWRQETAEDVESYRQLTPGKSRTAFPLSVWAALATQLKSQGFLRMALFLLTSVSSYARPSELLRMRVFGLVRPMTGITSSWALLLSPQEGGKASKTGDFDVSIYMDSPWMTPWAFPMFQKLKQGHPEEPLWDFNYDEYSREFNKAAAHLGLEVTPYQTRHSGPSIDRSRRLRSQAEVQKRGQWKTQKSVQRYEKSARLAATFDALPADLQTHCQLCERELTGIMCGTQEPPVFAVAKGSKVVM